MFWSRRIPNPSRESPTQKTPRPTLEQRRNKRDRFARFKDAGEFAFAAVLTFYGVLGYYLVRDQLRVMEQQTTVMQQQLADARRSAADADKLTERQFKIAEGQAESLKTLATTNKAMATANERQVVVAESQAVSLRRQADALQSQVESMGREIEALSSQAESMRTLAEMNKAIAETARVSADAATRAASTSAQQFEVADRPIVRFDVSLTRPIEFLSINSDDARNVTQLDIATADTSEFPTIFTTVAIAISLTNIGRSVANDVRVEARSAFVDPKLALWKHDVDRMAADTCTAAASTSVIPVTGNTVFPGDKITIHDYMTEGIEAKYITPSAPAGGVFSGRGKSVEMIITVCAVYTLSSSPTIRKTWFTYRLGRRVPPDRRPFDTWDLEIGKNVPLQEVVLEEWPWGGRGAT